jgi:hypothetical protein
MGEMIGKRILKKALKLKEKHELNDAQLLYIIYTYNNVDIYLDPVKFLELIELGILDNEGKVLADLSAEKSSAALVDKPKFSTPITKAIYMYIKSGIAFKDVTTGLAVSVDVSIGNQRSDKYKKRIESLINAKKKAFFSPYSVFLALFPTMNKVDNKKWNSFFKSGYDGMELRKKTQTNANRFLQHTLKCDMGIFMYSVYLFINNGISAKEDKTFIGSQKTFFSEFEDWYEKAEMEIEKIKKADDISLLFNRKNKSNFRGGGVAI